jgi:hypothetical protein
MSQLHPPGDTEEQGGHEGLFPWVSWFHGQGKLLVARNEFLEALQAFRMRRRNPRKSNDSFALDRHILNSLTGQLVVLFALSCLATLLHVKNKFNFVHLTCAQFRVVV